MVIAQQDSILGREVGNVRVSSGNSASAERYRNRSVDNPDARMVSTSPGGPGRVLERFAAGLDVLADAFDRVAGGQRECDEERGGRQ